MPPGELRGICPRKAEENWSDCPNQNHRAEALEERVQEAVSQLFRDPQAIEEQVERRLVDRAIYDPEKVKWREEWRARFERLLSKDGSQRNGGVMPCDGSS